MLGYMGCVGEHRHDLIAAELIIFSDIFDFVTGGKSPENGCDINSRPGDEGLPNRTAGSIVMPG
jgi:hypothetical protein